MGPTVGIKSAFAVLISVFLAGQAACQEVTTNSSIVNELRLDEPNAQDWANRLYSLDESQMTHELAKILWERSLEYSDQYCESSRRSRAAARFVESVVVDREAKSTELSDLLLGEVLYKEYILGPAQYYLERASRSTTVAKEKHRALYLSACIDLGFRRAAEAKAKVVQVLQEDPRNSNCMELMKFIDSPSSSQE